MRLLSTIAFSVLFFASQIKAQLTTTQTLTPQQLVQNVLLGGGVTASNITFTGNALQISKFTATPSTNLGIQSGILISTGNSATSSANGPQGPNNSTGTSTSHGGAGDAYLSALSSQSTFDAGVLEFDFIASGDTVKFRYVFASEEYPEYVNSINDAFALVLSGAGSTVLAPTNIAIIPTTTSGSNVVSINNINASTNSLYYINNASSIVNTEFDGLTTVLTAKYKVNCGQQYHIKIAIADGTDDQLDSGVFLEEGSFSSLPPLILNTTNANSFIPDTILVEDCNTNCINFIRNGNIANADSFNLQVAGNASLGVDYVQAGNPGFTWPTTIYFAANQDTLKFCNLTALQDGLIEGLDTIKFTMSSFATSSVSCLASNTIQFNLYIKDYTSISIAQNDVTLCSGTSTILNAGASDGYPAYTYSLSSPAVTTATLNTGPINSATVFTITVNDVCNKPVTKLITVTPVAIPTVTVNDTLLCAGNPGFLFASGASTYSWSSGATTSSITVTPTTTTNYTVVGSVGTCTNLAVSTVTVIGQAVTIAGNNNICIGQSSTLTASGGGAYTWDSGATTNTIVVTPTVNTTYTVTSIAASCTNMAVYTVSVSPIPTITVTGSVTCPGQNTTLTASGATFYSWSTGSLTNTTTVNPSVNTTYTVTGILAACTNTAAYTVTVIPTPSIPVSPPNPLICAGDSAVLSASGASSYTWTTGSTSFSTTVNPASTTNYTVVGTSANGCTNSAIFSLTVNPAPPVGSTATLASICVGTFTTLTGTGANIYTWNFGASYSPTLNVSPAFTTTYAVIGTNTATGCTSLSLRTVTVNPLPTTNTSASATTICAATSTTIPRAPAVRSPVRQAGR